MSNYPILNDYGYQIDTQLGHNREGGRITWKATDLKTQKIVVIKQFCFAQIDSNWSGYKAYEQELNILQKLDCWGIPKYFNSIETANGFCLIQEYITGKSLENSGQLTVGQIKQIGLKILAILVYLQQQNPPILHRDLKPDNILLDDQLNVYLIDFGFASLGSKEISGSSVFKGTPGFIAPEQIIQPTLASDLYSLGITLICLLANQKIGELRSYFAADDPYQIKVESVLPQLNRQAIAWLKKMTHVKTSKRFSNAQQAQAALATIDFEAKANLRGTQPNLDLELTPLINRPIIYGATAISSLSIIAIWGISYLDSHTGVTLPKIAIAVVASIAISIAELSAVMIAKTEPQAKLQGIILAVGLPLLLVAASGLIWGLEEAVDICSIIIIAEIFVLSYFWWQLPFWQKNNFSLKIGSLAGAIALGCLVGLKFIY